MRGGLRLLKIKNLTFSFRHTDTRTLTHTDTDTRSGLKQVYAFPKFLMSKSTLEPTRITLFQSYYECFRSINLKQIGKSKTRAKWKQKHSYIKLNLQITLCDLSSDSLVFFLCALFSKFCKLYYATDRVGVFIYSLYSNIPLFHKDSLLVSVPVSSFVYTFD